jgi:hypothetical protein
MNVSCSCGKIVRVPDHLAGKKIRCPSCKQTVLAEESTEPTTAVAAVQPPAKVRPQAPPEAAEARSHQEMRPVRNGERSATADKRDHSQGSKKQAKREKPAGNRSYFLIAGLGIGAVLLLGGVFAVLALTGVFSPEKTTPATGRNLVNGEPKQNQGQQTTTPPSGANPMNEGAKQNQGPPQGPDEKGGRGVISLSAARFTIDDVEIQLGQTTKLELEKILGPVDEASTPAFPLLEVSIWHKKGLRINSNKNSGKVSHLDCFFESTIGDLQPKEPCTHRIRVAGVEVSKATTKDMLQKQSGEKVHNSSGVLPGFSMNLGTHKVSFELTQDRSRLQFLSISRALPKGGVPGISPKEKS